MRGRTAAPLRSLHAANLSMGQHALFNAYDQDGNWYAMGFEFDSVFASWHPSFYCPEKPLWIDDLVVDAKRVGCFSR